MPPTPRSKETRVDRAKHLHPIKPGQESRKNPERTSLSGPARPRLGFSDELEVSPHAMQEAEARTLRLASLADAHETLRRRKSLPVTPSPVISLFVAMSSY